MQAQHVKKADETPVVVVSHQDERLIFNFKFFEKGKTPFPFDPLKEINLYWAQQPEEVQNAIFDVYRRMRFTMDTCSELTRLREQMRSLFSELVQLHPYDQIDLFTRFTLHCPIPLGIDEQFDPFNPNIIGTREMTYIKEDYRQLMTLSVALRPVGIVMGELIGLIEKEVGVVWKEYQAFRLLQNTWVYDSEPMRRLELYITANIQAAIDEEDVSKVMSPSLYAGLSSEDYPKWVLGFTVLKRVIYADITNLDEKSNIIQNIYGFMQTKLNNATASFKSHISDKDLISSIEGEEGKLSIFESYKAKIEVVYGDIAAVEFILEDPITLARHLEPDIEPALVQEALQALSALSTQRIMDGQVILMQWLMSNFFPVRTVPHLAKQYVITALAISTAVLWHRGFFSIAALMSAYPIWKEDDTITTMLDEEIRVPKHLIEKMESYYPYSKRDKTNKNRRRRPNPGSVALNNMIRRLTRHEWVVTLPDSWLSQVRGLNHHRHYQAQADLRLDLTNLIIDINERTKNELPATCDFTHGSSH